MLDAVNDTAAPYPGESCIHDLFAAQAARTPGRVACVDGTGSLTYAELDRRSTALARALLQASPVRQGRIAIAVDRSSALLVGLLGVMKAGHAYVPLDVRQPIERLRQIATQRPHRRHRLPGRDDRRDRARRLRRSPRQARSPTRSGPDAAARAVGRFRLCALHIRVDGHAEGRRDRPSGADQYLERLARLCEITADDVVIASSAVTFDASIPELFIPLIVGARVVLTDSEAVLTGFELVALADRTKATAAAGDADPVAHPARGGLRLAARPEDDRRRRAAAARRRRSPAGRRRAALEPLWTDGNGDLCIGLPRSHADGADITIGRPIANTQLYVLDDRDRIAPPGAFGTLFIGGDGLAKGYFDRPDLTARSFGKSRSRAGRRSASTAPATAPGCCRRAPSSSRGRNDRQVKLRGFRIELEEIESALRQAPDVRDCAVAAAPRRRPRARARGLCRAGRRADAAALRADLAQRLPDYMVPTRWVGLEALPLTAGGKLDRNALPRPAEVPRPAEPPAARTGTPLEATIAAVWAEVLGRSDFGMEDPLFSVGADSLHVFRIAARLQRQGIAVDARDLMKNPTVAALARKAHDKSRGPRERKRPEQAPALADFRRGARRRSVSS